MSDYNETFPKKVTIKDIALQSGYSPVTVHRALNHKPGISDEARDRIIRIATEMHYESNFVASALSRKKINLAVVMMDPAGSGQYYFQYMLRGIREYAKEVSSYNINFIECYFDGDATNEAQRQMEVLYDLYRDWGRKLDGLIIAPADNTPAMRTAIEIFCLSGTQVVLIDEVLEDLKPLCRISPSDIFTGRLGAEYLCSTLTEKSGTVLVAAGNRKSRVHHLNVQGFQDYFAINRPDVRVVCVEDEGDGEQYREKVRKLLETEKPVIGAYSVRAKNTIPFCRAIMESEEARGIRIVGSDLFEESARLLQDGVLSAIIYKNPYGKGRLAVKVLFDRLIRGETEQAEKVWVPINIILQSNLRFYREMI